ncbi:unnamed protein product [Urochloa humidicola]
MAQDPLRRRGRSPLADDLLDDFLRLAYAHCSFRAALVSIVALQSEARAMLRYEDPARFASTACALRRRGCDLPHIASTARAVAAKPPPTCPPTSLWRPPPSLLQSSMPLSRHQHDECRG